MPMIATRDGDYAERLRLADRLWERCKDEHGQTCGPRGELLCDDCETAFYLTGEGAPPTPEPRR